MADESVNRAIALLGQRRYQDAADYCRAQAENQAAAGGDPAVTLLMCEAVAASGLGLIGRAKAIFQLIWRHRRVIMKWGRRGLKLIHLLLLIIALPGNIDELINRFIDLVSEGEAA